jgi:formylglycine-generating enzyme required for sulfatase activity
MQPGSKGRKTAIFLGATVSLCLVAFGIAYRSKIESWYIFLTQFTRLPLNAQGYPEYQHKSTGTVFVRLPGGKFLMGTGENEPGRYSDDGPAHEVEVGSFLIAKYELTEGQWQKVLGSDPSNSKYGPHYPVENVSCGDAKAFCKRLGLKLPTEAQWEYACRGPETRTGGPFGGTGKSDDMGWHYSNSRQKTHLVGQKHPVGQKKPNGFGLHDMHGNVAEWCADEYGEQSAALRGGSWCEGSWRCRSASRRQPEPEPLKPDFGFPPALSGFPPGVCGFRPALDL